MKLLVCGGRDFEDQHYLVNILTRVVSAVPVEEIITGGAPGVDTLARNWAETQTYLTSTVFPANWDKHGKAAGGIRNAKMLEQGKPDFVLAFPGGRGTLNMVSQAKKKGVPVIFASMLVGLDDDYFPRYIESRLAL